MTEQEYAEAFQRIQGALTAGTALVEIWDMRDKTVMEDNGDNRRVADTYRYACVRMRLADGSAGDLVERLPIRRIDEPALVELGATVRGRAAIN